MHHPEPVRFGQRGGHLPQDPGCLGGRESAPVVQVLAQAATVDEVHDEAQGLADGEQVANPHDVLVAQHQQDGAFLHEPGDQLRLPYQFLTQQLDGHLVAGRPVDGAPHGTGGAVADRPDQEVRVAHTAAAEAARGIVGGEGDVGGGGRGNHGRHSYRDGLHRATRPRAIWR